MILKKNNEIKYLNWGMVSVCVFRQIKVVFFVNQLKRLWSPLFIATSLCLIVWTFILLCSYDNRFITGKWKSLWSYSYRGVWFSGLFAHILTIQNWLTGGWAEEVIGRGGDVSAAESGSGADCSAGSVWLMVKPSWPAVMAGGSSEAGTTAQSDSGLGVEADNAVSSEPRLAAGSAFAVRGVGGENKTGESISGTGSLSSSRPGSSFRSSALMWMASAPSTSSRGFKQPSGFKLSVSNYHTVADLPHQDEKTLGVITFKVLQFKLPELHSHHVLALLQQQVCHVFYSHLKWDQVTTSYSVLNRICWCLPCSQKCFVKMFAKPRTTKRTNTCNVSLRVFILCCQPELLFAL